MTLINLKNYNVSVSVFEVDEEQEQIVISRKLKNKDAKCHVDLLRIDEDDSSHYVYQRLQQTFIISLTFADIVIMVLELKNY